MRKEVDKAAMARLLHKHGLATAPAHQIELANVEMLLDLYPTDVRLVARTSRRDTTDRNLPRLVDATAPSIIDWSHGLEPGMVLIVSPYGHLIASGEVAVTSSWALVEAVYGVWELENRHRPGSAAGRRSGDGVTWTRSILATADARRRFSFEAGVAPDGPLPSWLVRAFCNWTSTQASALEAFASAVGQPQIVKVLLYAEWGMQAINARPLGDGFEAEDHPPAPPLGTPIVASTDQVIARTPAVILSVSAAREEAASLEGLIDRMVQSGVRTAYVESGLLSHTAIALREAGIRVRQA